MEKREEQSIVNQKIEEAIDNLAKSMHILAFKVKNKSLERLASYTESSDTAVVDLSVSKEIEKKFLEKFPVKKFPVLISFGKNIYDDEDLLANLERREEAEAALLKAKVDEMVRGEKTAVFIFIKGTPEHPECKFTRQLIQQLDDMALINGRHYNYFNIFTDPKLRKEMKKINKWPTFPQIYIKGTFMGGLDIFKTIIKNGIFNELIKED